MTKGSIYLCLDWISRVRLVVVARQPRTTTTEAWVVVGEGYIIIVVVVFGLGDPLGSVWFWQPCTAITMAWVVVGVVLFV